MAPFQDLRDHQVDSTKHYDLLDLLIGADRPPLGVGADRNELEDFAPPKHLHPPVIVIEYNSAYPADADWKVEYQPKLIYNCTSYMGASLTTRGRTRVCLDGLRPVRHQRLFRPERFVWRQICRAIYREASLRTGPLLPAALRRSPALLTDIEPE